MAKTTVKLYAFVQQALLELNNKKDSLINHLSHYQDQLSKNAHLDSEVNRYEKLTSGLLDLLEHNCLSSEVPQYKELTLHFQPVSEYVETHEELLVKKQEKERFYPQPKDSIILILGKFNKRFWLKLGWLIIRFFNIFRKNKHPLNYWNHKIKARHLAHYHYHFKFHTAFMPHFREFLTKRYSLLLDLNKFDNAYEKKMLDISDSADISPSKIQGYAGSLNELAVHLEKNMALLEKQLRSEFKKKLETGRYPRASIFSL